MVNGNKTRHENLRFCVERRQSDRIDLEIKEHTEGQRVDDVTSGGGQAGNRTSMTDEDDPRTAYA
jgi:hypothetical protein